MLLSNLDVLATAPGGVARLRELILTLAVQGKLVPQDPVDEPASELLKKIRAEKDRLIAEGKIRRDRPVAEIAEDEKPFELPDQWEWVRLGALLPYRIGKTPPSKDPRFWADDGQAWVSISDMTHFGEVFETGRKITEAGADFFSYDPLPEGTLIMSFKLTIGKISFLRVPAYHNEAIVSFTPLEGLETDFLKYMLPAVSKTGASKDALMGATLNTESLSNLIIAVPPRAEQSRIVTRVEELMRLCDALEAKGQLEAAQHAQLVSTLLGQLTASSTPDELHDNWQRVAQHFDLLLDRPAAVDALEQTILQLAVRGLLVAQDPTDEPASTLLRKIRVEKDRLIAEGKIKRDKPLSPITEDEMPFELPVGWAWVAIDALAQIGSGTTPSRDNPAYFAGGTIPWVTSGETGQAFIDTTEQRVTEIALAQTSLTFYPAGTLIVAMYGQGKTRGQVAELRISATTNQACAAVVLIEGSAGHRAYVKLVFEKSYDEIREQSAGGAQPNLNVGKVKSTLIPLPPLAEQSRIVTRVESLRRLCSDLRQRLAACQAVQTQLAKALVDLPSTVPSTESAADVEL